MPSLIVVACGAPLARTTVALADELRGAGWEVDVIGTDASRQWLTAAQHQEVPRRPDAVVVCPLSFNTANKLASGVSDTHVMGLLNESLGAGIRMVAVPMVNESLWRHPVWPATLHRLSSSGVQWISPIDGSGDAQPVPHGSGDAIADAFDVRWVTDALG
jgi:phosphopantothenoylcysteine synthetase/decarboxylase